MMIFGGGKILFIFGALIFALHFSISNAYYLNNYGYSNGTVPENYMKDKKCDGCVGYKCKLNDGKIIEGKDCLKNVVKFCEISKLDESMLNSVVQDQVFEYKSETYFIFSCQDNKNVNDAIEDEEDYMDVILDLDQMIAEDNERHDDNDCYDVSVSFPQYDKVSDHKEYVKNRTKCIFLRNDHFSSEHIRKSQNAFIDVKMAAEEVLKTFDELKKVANEIQINGEYFKKEVNEIAKKADNVTNGSSNVDQMLKILNASLIDIEKKCAEFNETVKACLNETVKCTIGQYNHAAWDCEYPRLKIEDKGPKYVKNAKELMVLINEIKSEAEKVFMEANVALTAQNALKLAKEAKKVGEEAKKAAKESKEIGENSNKTANFAVEIGMEAKMTANESMKIGNEANQKIMEVEKLAKDSLKLAEKNQKEGDKTEAEIQKLKSNGEKNGCKFGIFGISLFAFTFLY